MLERLLLAHSNWFDTYRDYEFEGRTFPGYAEFHTHGEQYVLVKRAKLWEIDSHEYMFFQTASALDETSVQDWISFMRERGFTKAQPQPNHMSSNITLVLIADSTSDDAAKAVKSCRFRKNFKLGFEGWADLRLAVVDLQGRRVITNGAGKDLVHTLRANTWPEERKEAASKGGRLQGKLLRRKS